MNKATMNPQVKVVFFIIFLSFFLAIAENCKSETLFVQGDKVNLRSSPDHKSDILWEYSNGFPLQVLKSQGDWKFVKDFENDSGWIHQSLLQKGSQVIVKANKKSGGKINIRSEPGLNKDVVGNAYYGVVFTAIKNKGSWIKVRHESGLTGWVKADLLWGL